MGVFCTVAVVCVCRIRTASGAFFGNSFAVTIHFWAVQISKRLVGVKCHVTGVSLFKACHDEILITFKFFNLLFVFSSVCFFC